MTLDRLRAALADRYTIERELGQGGMATVYLAQDLKHKRQVAIKVLKPELAAVLGAERFVHEIETTAQLQHPHILPLFDSGESDGFLWYAMPYIQGETLRDRLDRETQLGVDEAVRITTDVADALGYAHGKGVIHRDIKPENILLANGRPMVADFGIALALSAAAGGRMTETGLSLGTPHYMSPEQATAEKEITARSDVYSLASVLYEMLAGQPPHLGGSAQQIIMKIIAEPVEPVTRYRKSVPANVAAAVAKGLEKLPADRFESAKAFAEALGNPGFTFGWSTDARGAGGATLRWNRLSIALAAITAVLLTTTLWGWRDRTPLLPATRSSIDLGDIEVPPSGDLLVSRDGSRFAVTSTGGPIYWRSAGEEKFRPIPGTENAAVAAFSPDGLELVYGRSFNTDLKRVDLVGGDPQPVTTMGGSFGGLDWGEGDAIVFTTRIGRGLYLVPAGGGVPDTILSRDVPVRNPSVLPGGGRILFTRDSGGTHSTQLVDVASREVRLVQTGALDARYVEPGYLVYADESGTLWGARFDLGKGQVAGDPFIIRAGVTVDPDRGDAHLAVSQRAGTLIFGASGVTQGGLAGLQLVEVAMDGTPRILSLAPRPIGAMAISPSGRSIAFSSATNGVFTQLRLYIYDLVLEASPRLLATDGIPMQMVWSPDETRLAMTLVDVAAGPVRMVIKEIAGNAPDRVLLSGGDGASANDVGTPSAWPTEDSLLIQRGGFTKIASLWHMVLSPDTTIESLYLPTEKGPRDAQVSRQRALVAYKEAGVIWVRDYPVAGPPTQISDGRGEWPKWSPDGLTVYYWIRPAEDNYLLLAARLRRSPSLAVTRTDTIFTTSSFRAWDIYPDGQKFLVAQPVVDSAPRTPAPRERFSMITNFVQELKRLAPP
jgi:serine/threonine-protein kinase